ncbi:MAG: HesA/MoeB/ThiF family protein [Sphingomicrobium sp.]
MSLTDDELNRYARHIVLPQIGGVGQKKLKTAKVAVIGAGGVGCAVIPALAGAGIGRLTIIDCDTVDLSNLHRQPLFTEGDVGQGKALLAAKFVNNLNHFIDVAAIEQRIDTGNTDGLLAGHDLIIDGSDNFATRLAVSDASVRLGTPLISAAAMMFQGQIGLFRGQPCYRCFVGDAFDNEDCDTCAERGVMGALTGTIGNMAALMAINLLCDVGPDPSGKVQLLDGETLAWRVIRIPADPACGGCA